MDRTLIWGGTVIDGSGAPGQKQDILIENGKIACVARNIRTEDAEKIDASGMTVTPGWIDIHRHCDIAALSDAEFGLAELAQGLTTVVGGNCGLSLVPMSEKYAGQAKSYIAPCLGQAGGLLFENAGAYMRALNEQNLRLRMGMLVGLGAVRAAVKGYEKAPFTENEMAQAREKIAEGLEAGMLGLSVGVMYAPECYNTEDEYIALLSAAAPYHRPVCCHIRGEGDSLVPSVREVIRWGERAGIPVHISHFKCTGIRNWGRGIEQAIEEIEKARARGLDVTCDVYPYDAGATTMASLLPPSVMEDDNERLWDKLATGKGVEQVREALAKSHPGWDDMIQSIGWARISVSHADIPEDYTGKNMEEIAAMRRDGDLVAALCDMLARSRGNAGVVVHSMAQEDVDRVMKLPYANVISDALYGEGGSHPRRWGAYAKVIREYVLERGVLTLPEAIHKMTALPADVLGLRRLGRIQEGMKADLCIFRPEDVRDHATYQTPEAMSSGMERILIDGKTVWLHGKETGEQEKGRAVKAE